MGGTNWVMGRPVGKVYEHGARKIILNVINSTIGVKTNGNEYFYYGTPFYGGYQ